MQNHMFFQSLKEILSKKDLRAWIIFGFILNIIAAIFSDGFLHWDEYFEILEFMNYKLGGTPQKDLSFEFSIGMRPWLQPFTYFIFTKILNFLGIVSPFILTAFFRISSALIGELAVLFLIVTSYKKWNLKDGTLKWAVILFNTIWFFPFMHARLSGETVGGSLFTIGFALLILGTKKEKTFTSLPILKSIIIGLLLGFSLCLRYHIGIMVFTLFLWVVTFKKLSLKTILVISFSVFLAIGISTIINYWGYGRWVFAPWLYFRENIVNDIASYWGTAPWWDYFRLTIKKGIFPVGIIFILSALPFWVKNYKSELTWVALPFFIIHCAVAHKELRFLFPIAHFLPIFIVWVIAHIFSKIKNKKLLKTVKILLGISLITNTTFLPIASFKKAHSSMGFFKHSYAMKQKIKKLYILGDVNPYGLAALNVHYYNFHYPEVIDLKSDNASLILDRLDSKSDFHVFSIRGKHYLQMKEIKHCTVEYLSYPEWLFDINLTNWLQRSKIWALYHCKKK